ncbi:hypothetical protein ACK6S7_11330, partial [Proteus mirabilis]|uniref:phage tail fiber protein n=1 Tax=Proteus mirabilis TaxID=584 RepID=UPI0039B3E3C2
MDQWMMNNGVVTVELSNGQKVTLDSIKKMQGDIANKLDIKIGGNVTARVSANPISVTRDNSSFCNLYPAKDDSGMAFFQYNKGTTWNGALNIPKVSTGGIWEMAIKVGQYITNYGNNDWTGLRLYKGNGEYGFIETNSTSNEIFTIGYRNAANVNQGIISIPKKNGTMMLVGDYGIGSVSLPILNNFRKPSGSGLLRYTNNTLNIPEGMARNPFGTVITLQYDGDYNYQSLVLGNFGRWFEIYRVTNGVPSSVQVMVSDMWTVDSNGFYKRASPIIDINPDGTFTTNDESEGATVTRVAQGEYLIEGVLGFNSDAGWGGVDGGIEIPLDVNKQPLIWVDSKVMEDGSILVRTYHRTHPNAPEFANNKIDGYKDGDPIDIPDGRFISVRVQMPEQSIYNVRMREMEEAQKAEEELRQKEDY